MRCSYEGVDVMDKDKKITVIYSSTNEKKLEEVLVNLIKIHENCSVINKPIEIEELIG